MRGVKVAKVFELKQFGAKTGMNENCTLKFQLSAGEFFSSSTKMLQKVQLELLRLNSWPASCLILMVGRALPNIE